MKCKPGDSKNLSENNGKRIVVAERYYGNSRSTDPSRLKPQELEIQYSSSSHVLNLVYTKIEKAKVNAINPK